MDTPKRKRRRKRRQQSQPPQQPQTSSNSTQLSHTADEEGGGPSTSTSSSRRKKVRSSSWSPAKKKHGSKSKEKEKEKEFLIAPEHQSQLPEAEAEARPSPLSATILIQEERDRSSTGGGSVISSSKSVGLLSVKGSNKKDADGSRTPTNGAGVAEDVFGSVTTGPTNLSGKRSKKMGKKERERERVKKDLMIGKSLRKETVVGKASSRGSEVTHEDDDDDNEGDNDENDDEEDDDLSIEDSSSLDNLSLLQPPQSIRRQKGKDIAHIHNRAGIAGAYKSTPGSPKRRREFDDILVDPDDGGEHGHESLGDLDVEDNAGGGGGGSLDVAPDEPISKKRPSSKRRRGLVRVRSVPQLDAEEPTPCVVEETIITPGKFKSKKSKSKAAAVAAISALIPAFSDGVDLPQPRTKRARLIALAKELRQFFPEQRQELRRVTLRFEKQGMEPSGKGKKTFLTGDAVTVGGSIQLPAKSAPIPVPGVRKSKRGIHRRSGSESAIVDTNDDSIEGGDAAGRDGMPGVEEEEEEEEEELDPRGRPPKKGDVLIHIFIDQLSFYCQAF
jgi:hypothetical protein